MNWGSFAGGLAKGLDKSTDPLGLKKMMTGGGAGQGQGAPQMAPGFEDPNAMISQASMPMSAMGQPDQFAPQPNFLQQLLKVLGGLGG